MWKWIQVKNILGRCCNGVEINRCLKTSLNVMIIFCVLNYFASCKMIRSNWRFFNKTGSERVESRNPNLRITKLDAWKLMRCVNEELWLAAFALMCTKATVRSMLWFGWRNLDYNLILIINLLNYLVLFNVNDPWIFWKTVVKDSLMMGF